MTQETETITSNDELIQLVKDGYFFMFCIAFALNKGMRNVIKEKKEVKFSVGDYDVTLDHKTMCFEFVHKTYFARIMMAYHNEVVFIGTDEQECINDLLAEVKKEIEKL